MLLAGTKNLVFMNISMPRSSPLRLYKALAIIIIIISSSPKIYVLKLLRERIRYEMNGTCRYSPKSQHINTMYINVNTRRVFCSSLTYWTIQRSSRDRAASTQTWRLHPCDFRCDCYRVTPPTCSWKPCVSPPGCTDCFLSVGVPFSYTNLNWSSLLLLALKWIYFLYCETFYYRVLKCSDWNVETRLLSSWGWTIRAD